MTRNLRGGKGITHCRLPYGHVTLIAYYSIADRQPVVRCNWRRANWTWVSRILARTDDKRGWKTRNKSSLCRWQFRLIPFGGRVASGTAEETSRRNGSRLPHAPPPPPSKNPMRSSLQLDRVVPPLFRSGLRRGWIDGTGIRQGTTKSSRLLERNRSCRRMPGKRKPPTGYHLGSCWRKRCWGCSWTETGISRRKL